jgi:hypothetical protein
MIVNVDINTLKKVFILQGDIAFLINNKRILVYLKEYLYASFIENSIRIPYESNNKNRGS